MQAPSLNLKKGGQAGKTSFFYWLLIIAHSTKHLIIYSQLYASCTISQKHIIRAFVLYVLCALKLHVSLKIISRILKHYWLEIPPHTHISLPVATPLHVMFRSSLLSSSEVVREKRGKSVLSLTL